MDDKYVLGQILRFKVFVRGATQVELRYDFPTFQGKGENARRDAFAVYFVAAGRTFYPKPRLPTPQRHQLYPITPRVFPESSERYALFERRCLTIHDLVNSLSLSSKEGLVSFQESE